MDFIQDWVDQVRVMFAPLDLRFAKKSGRMPAAAAFMGEALGLKPIMTFANGDSKILTKVRGEKNAISAVVDLCQKERRADSPYLLIRGNNDVQSASSTRRLSRPWARSLPWSTTSAASSPSTPAPTSSGSYTGPDLCRLAGDCPRPAAF